MSGVPDRLVFDDSMMSGTDLVVFLVFYGAAILLPVGVLLLLVAVVWMAVSRFVDWWRR